ncbi:MAG: hypothetical protein E7370_03915 [Clostridiales bacterium]|nr:hypothetical protein [Clostridiales bacterium]
MNFEQLTAEIFENYYQKHKKILDDNTVNSQVQAERILAKYDTSNLTEEQIKILKDKIVKKEVDEFILFTSENEEILDSKFTYQEKLEILLAKYDNGDLSNEEYKSLKSKISRHIFDFETAKVLEELAIKLKLLKP